MYSKLDSVIVFLVQMRIELKQFSSNCIQIFGEIENLMPRITGYIWNMPASTTIPSSEDEHGNLPRGPGASTDDLLRRLTVTNF